MASLAHRRDKMRSSSLSTLDTFWLGGWKGGNTGKIHPEWPQILTIPGFLTGGETGLKS